MEINMRRVKGYEVAALYTLYFFPVFWKTIRRLWIIFSQKQSTHQGKSFLKILCIKVSYYFGGDGEQTNTQTDWYPITLEKGTTNYYRLTNQLSLTPKDRKFPITRKITATHWGITSRNYRLKNFEINQSSSFGGGCKRDELFRTA